MPTAAAFAEWRKAHEAAVTAPATAQLDSPSKMRKRTEPAPAPRCPFYTFLEILLEICEDVRT